MAWLKFFFPNGVIYSSFCNTVFHIYIIITTHQSNLNSELPARIVHDLLNNKKQFMAFDGVCLVM